MNDPHTPLVTGWARESPDDSWHACLIAPFTHVSLARPVTVVLLASGLLHLTILWVSGAEWDGALSPRKPALFGISASVTVWSLAWIMTKLQPHRFDATLFRILALSLLIEVGLITLQHWRGVPSHFNHATKLDATIEAVMLGLILIVSIGIAWLAVRSNWLVPMDRGMALALRGGLWLLVVSCLLGLVATSLGELNQSRGRSPETWGNAGVLKYPHGAALHAIQILPVFAWALSRMRISNRVGCVRAAIASQCLFMVHAIWQTSQGRSRLDWDVAGCALFIAAAGSLIVASTLIVLKRKDQAPSNELNDPFG